MGKELHSKLLDEAKEAVVKVRACMSACVHACQHVCMHVSMCACMSACLHHTACYFQLLSFCAYHTKIDVDICLVRRGGLVVRGMDC